MAYSTSSLTASLPAAHVAEQDAQGSAEARSLRSGMPNTTVDYCGNLVYNGTGLARILLGGEGYCRLANGSPSYYFFIKDHLGSTRAVVRQDGGASKNQYLTATGNGFTNSQPQSRRVAAGNVQELPIPIGNISHAQLNINSCKSNSTTQKPLLGSKKTLMKVFAESFDFQAVRGSSVGVSYGRLDLLPHPQYFTREGWFKNWEYIGKPIRRPATSPVFRYNDALYFRTGGMK